MFRATSAIRCAPLSLLARIMPCGRRLETRPRLGARGWGAVTTKSCSRPAAFLTSDRGQRAQYQNAPALAELHESEPACGQLGAQCNINKAAATVPERRSTLLRGLPVRYFCVQAVIRANCNCSSAILCSSCRPEFVLTTHGSGHLVTVVRTWVGARAIYAGCTNALTV